MVGREIEFGVFVCFSFHFDSAVDVCFFTLLVEVLTCLVFQLERQQMVMNPKFAFFFVSAPPSSFFFFSIP